MSEPALFVLGSNYFHPPSDSFFSFVTKGAVSCVRTPPAPVATVEWHNDQTKSEEIQQHKKKGDIDSFS